ncbi:uncharacterized protein LOC142804036 [Rhipicephalus microplus]|uniref:uncharacterized protein LOC142804036 n=1 Tax=Rhipicephalus microplus TaxID=6941 RepID=UPI003F6AFCDE
MFNESFDCDAALTALEFAFEELALRQLRDADYEREVDNLERKKFRLEACLRAVNLKLEQLLRDAARQESAILRELERQINVLMQELSKAKEEATELEQQFASVEAKCDELRKQNDDLRSTATELEKEVEQLKWQDTDSAAGGFNTKKLSQELRFEVAQLEQEHRELCEVERHSAIRVETLIAEIRRSAELMRQLDADNDALRLKLIKTKALLSCGLPTRRRCQTSGAAKDDSGAKGATADYSCHVTDADDDVRRNSLEHQEQRRQQLWDIIVRIREEFAVLLKKVGYREGRNVSVQTEPEPTEDHQEEPVL